MTKYLLCIAMGILILGDMPTANAAFFAATFRGTGSGTVGSTSFTNAAFTIEAQGDTVAIFDFFDIPTIPAIPVTARINIAGVGTGIFQLPLQIFNQQDSSVLGLANFNDFATLDGLGDLLDITHPSLATYNFRSSFGPVFDPTPLTFALGQFQNVPLNNRLVAQ